MQLGSPHGLPSTPKSLLPPSPISDTLSSAHLASRTGIGGQGLLAPGVAQTAAKPVVAPKPTPAGAAKAPATSTDQSGTSSSSVFDLSTDPIVAKIQALNAANYQQAVAQADAQRKQLLIQAGFPDLARAAEFGSLEAPVTGDAATALAAQQNPNSTAAQLALANTQANQGIDTSENKANLYFSSDRANKLGAQAHTYLGNIANAESQVEQQLSSILQTLLQTRNSEQSSLADTLEQARQNAISDALASGSSFVGYDANGNPIFQSAPAAAAAAPAAVSPVTVYSAAGGKQRIAGPRIAAFK